MKKYLFLGLSAAALLFTGCSYKYTQTPAAITFNGNSVDFQNIDKLKKVKICKDADKVEGDLSLLKAAKEKNLSKIVFFDKTYEYKQFLFWTYGKKDCVVVYGK